MNCIAFNNSDKIEYHENKTRNNNNNFTEGDGDIYRKKISLCGKSLKSYGEF